MCLSSLFFGKMRDSSVSLIFFFLGPVYRPEGPVDRFMAAANADSTWRHLRSGLKQIGSKVYVCVWGLGSHKDKPVTGVTAKGKANWAAVSLRNSAASVPGRYIRAGAAERTRGSPTPLTPSASPPRFIAWSAPLPGVLDTCCKNSAAVGRVWLRCTCRVPTACARACA